MAAPHSICKVTVIPPRAAQGEKNLYCLARWRDPKTGKTRERRISAKTDDPALAELVRASWEADVRASLEADLGGGLGEVPPAPALERYLSLVDARIAALMRDPEASPNTVRNYQTLRKALAPTVLGRVSCAELRAAHVLEAQGELARDSEGNPRKASTVRLMLQQAAAVWRWAQDGELVSAEWPRLPRQRRIKRRTTNTAKRPYSDQEVARILAWVAANEAAWLPVFALLADTGQRIGAVLGLQGRDVAGGAVTFSRQWVPGVGSKPGGWRPLKAREVVTVELPASTLELLPKVAGAALLFPHEGDPSRPQWPQRVRAALDRAIAAVGIADPENLDTHSLRRAWVSTAKEQEVPDTVGMRVTGHREREVYDGYARNAAFKRATRDAVERVHRARVAAGAKTSTQPPRVEELSVGSAETCCGDTTCRGSGRCCRTGRRSWRRGSPRTPRAAGR